MIGPIETALVGRATPVARVRRRAMGLDDTATEEGSAVGAEVAPHLALRPVEPGFDKPEPGQTPRPPGRNVASAALSAILALKRGG